MADEGLGALFNEIEMPLIGVLVGMENVGVAIDVERLEEIRTRMRTEIDSLTERIHQLAGGPFTIDSPKQLAEVLFERLGLPAEDKSQKHRADYDAAYQAEILLALLRHDAARR